jgi:iron(III) transport system substrate-binding protein
VKRLAVVVALIAIVGSACSSDSDEGSITLYSGRSEDLVQPVIDAFVAETGIDVTVKYAGSADLAATSLEEGDASPADVFFAQDPASLGTVSLAGLFEPLPAETLAKVPSHFGDDAGGWIGTSARSRVVVYNADRVSEAELPQDEDGFTDPVWAGRVGIAPTNGSFLAFVSAKILLDGEDATLAWLEAMAANGSPTFPNNSAIVAAIDAGELDAGLVNHYYLLQARAQDPNVPGVNYFFSEPTAGSLVMTAGAGVLKSSGNKEAAIAFVNWLLNDESQAFFAEDTFEYPLVATVPADPQLPPISSMVTPAMDLSDLATVLDVATDLVAQAGLL